MQPRTSPVKFARSLAMQQPVAPAGSATAMHLVRVLTGDRRDPLGAGRARDAEAVGRPAAGRSAGMNLWLASQSDELMNVW